MTIWSKVWIGCTCATALTISIAHAATPLPLTDDTVLARVPLRPRAATATQAATAADMAGAIATAQSWIQKARTDNNPRAYGYAQQALAAWWTQTNAPLALLRVRAQLLQTDHQFAASYADLKRILATAPNDAQAHLDAATLLITTAQYETARGHCDALARIAPGAVAALCSAQLDATTGHAQRARTQLKEVLAAKQIQSNSVQAWAHTLLAEIEARIGDPAAAQRAFSAALNLNPSDHYARVAFADFLLSRQTAPQVLPLFSATPIERLPDASLLRYAIAARETKQPNAPALAAEIRTRLAAALLRGDDAHLREAALAALSLDDDAPRAAQLALKNWALQKEPTDALLLWHAGVAAKDQNAMATARAWFTASAFEHPVRATLSLPQQTS